MISSISVPPGNQMIVDYLNAVNEVNKFVLSLQKLNLLPLTDPPENYADYANHFGKVQLDALSWIKEVAPDFNDVPAAIIGANPLIQIQLEEVLAKLQDLKVNPGKSADITAITTLVNNILQEEQQIYALFQGMEKAISNFSSNLPGDIKTLDTIITEIKNTITYDESLVAKLHAVNQTMQDEIDARNKLITLNTIGNDVFTAFITVVGIAVGLPFSGTAAVVAGIIGGVGGWALTTFIPINTSPDYTNSIDDIQAQMDRVTAEIGLENTIIGQLETSQKQFQAFVDASSNTAAQIAQINSFWTSRSASLTDFSNELQGLLSDLNDRTQIDTAIAELNAAKEDWNNLEGFMTQISKMNTSVQQLNSTALEKEILAIQA